MSALTALCRHRLLTTPNTLNRDLQRDMSHTFKSKLSIHAMYTLQLHPIHTNYHNGVTCKCYY